MDAIWSLFRDSPETIPSNEEAFGTAPKRAKISHRQESDDVPHPGGGDSVQQPTGLFLPLPVLLPSFPFVTSSALSPESTLTNQIIHAPKPAPVAQSSEKKNSLYERHEARKKRNREHAKKTRDRKKKMEEMLHLKFRALQGENDRLKSLVKSQIPHHAQEIIGECCYRRHKLFPGDDQSSKLVQSDFELIESLTKTRQSFVLTDPRLADNPIVYASPAFLNLTGYAREQVMGRNCRFLQGIDTDHKSVGAIREAIQSGEDGAACLLNYRADGTPFWNQFFVAALCDKEKRIVNFVGVQCEVSGPNEVMDKQAQQPSTKKNPRRPAVEQVSPNESNEKPGALPDIKLDTEPTNDLDVLDWSQLAKILEDDYQDEPLGGMEGDAAASSEDTDSPLVASRVSGQSLDNESVLRQFVDCPRLFITQTVRCELIEAVLACKGDLEDNRFTAALEVLSKIFKATVRTNTSLSPILNGKWKSISRPSYHYGGCLGCNEQGDFVYTLGKMCFNMFNPGNLRVTVQNTMNKIEPVCRMDKAPNAAPWSLRRELAMQDPGSLQILPNTTLKSYDIVVALTIEPGQLLADKEVVPSPPRRLRAMHIVNGYFLPDPNTPNRLTVWFTGGKLSPAGPPRTDDAGEYGTLDDWFALFGAEHKRTWRESFSVMGAKLLFGAELPDGMEADGSMSYMLHRPHGGHGKAYVDILYVDDALLIVKGNSGTLHVMINKGSIH